MWEARDINIKLTMKIIYVKLLDEGVKVYRPVPAIKKENNIYEIQGYDIYDMEDETWEFTPGSCVLVEKQILNGEGVLVAISKS
jgi:hypothetical protein